MTRRVLRKTLVVLGSLALAACDGDIFSPSPGSPGSPGQPGSGDPSTAVTMAPLVWLPQRVRRLSNRELDNAVADLLGTSTKISTLLPKDLRQSGYTSNVDQRVDETYGGQLQGAVDSLAQEAVTQRLSTLVGCSSASDPRGCATTFIGSFGARAFRRPLTDDDRNGLLAVYDVASGDLDPDGGAIGTFADGIAAVISAVLQSGSFLYVTELGQGTGALVDLDPYETASALSFLIAAAPPDAQLLQAAAQDALRTPDQREAAARRLAASNPHAPPQLTRIIKEWLGLDQLSAIDRVSTVSQSFSTLSPWFDAETDAFVEDVIAHGDGTLATLLTADFTMADADLAGFYGVPHSGSAGAWVQTSVPAPRRGILTQPNFSSTYASSSPAGSSPVKRGKAVLNQLLCRNLQLPVDPALAMQAAIPPPPNPNETTRQRFEEHATNPACASCHVQLDGIGFGFENFDQVGSFRSTENGQPIDASGQLIGTDVDGPFDDATGLTQRLAQSEQVRRCFARNVFRFASAQTSDGTEAQYLDVWSAMDATKRPQLEELLIGYVRSDMFMKRRPQ
jgi:hypothetical protein